MKRFLRVILIIISILAVAILGMGYFLDQKIDDVFRSRINAQLGEEYTFDFRKSDLNILNNDFRIKDLSISRSTGDSLRWTFKVDQVKLTGFKPIAFLKDQLLAADSISIKRPTIEVYQIDLGPKQQGKQLKQDSTQSLDFAIHYIRIGQGRVVYDPSGPERLQSDLNVDIRGIFFEGNILSMLDNIDDLTLSLPNMVYVTADSIYTVQADLLELSSADDAVVIDSFSVKNNIGLTQFSRFMHWRKGLFDINIPRISMTLPTPYQDTGWSVKQLSLSDPIIRIMKDLRFPLPDRKTELPQEQLQNMALKFRIDSLSLTNAVVELSSRVSGASTSDLIISDINGLISELQNFDLTMPAYQLVADGKLMGQADLHAEVTYLYGDLNPFHLNGNVNDIKLAFLDNYLRRQVGVTIASGELDGIEFNMTGDHNGISGEVDFRYHDLKVHIVDKDTDKDKVILNILSDSAGDFVFYRSNPWRDEFRLGRFTVERDVRKGFIAQWVDGLMQGITNTVSRKELDLKNPKVKEQKHHQKNDHKK